MSALPSWTAEYSVGSAELDSQHQSLFRIVQQLRVATEGGHGQEIVGQVLAKVVNYTMYHFATEEDLMQWCGYPGLNVHRIEHHTLTVRLMQLQEQYRSGELGAAESCMRVLESWVKEHVLKSDMRFAPFLRTKMEQGVVPPSGVQARQDEVEEVASLLKAAER